MRASPWLRAAFVLLFGFHAFADEPPAPGEPRAVKFAEAESHTLANGLEVLVVPRPGLPLLAAQFSIRSGAETDPPDLAGLATMTAALLTRGTKTRTAPEIAAGIEALGGRIVASATWDASTVTLSVLSSENDAALGIFADVIREPAFAAAEIERIRRETLDDLRIAYEEPRNVALTAMQRVLYGQTPYGHARTGTPGSIARIDRESITRLHATRYRPDNAVLVFAGDLTAKQGFNRAENLFGDWKNPATPMTAPDFSKEPPRPRTVVIDMPNAGQAAVVVGSIGIARDSADLTAGLVANGVLGNGYTSRLNSEIRIKRGLTYGARSVLQTLAHPGPFLAYAQTKNSAALEVAGLIRESLAGLAKEPVPKDELTPRVSTLAGDFARRLETNEGYAAAVSDLAIYRRPQSELNGFISGVQSLSPAQAKDFVVRELPISETSLVIAGRYEDFREAFEKAGIKAEIVPQSDLNLDAVSLRSFARCYSPASLMTGEDREAWERSIAPDRFLSIAKWR